MTKKKVEEKDVIYDGYIISEDDVGKYISIREEYDFDDVYTSVCICSCVDNPDKERHNEYN